MARTAVSLVLVAALLCLVFLVQSHIDDTFGEYRATEEILYVDDAKVLKKVMRGFENLAADVYWLRVVQYFGGKRREVTNKNYDLLEPLLEITVTLDPRFRVAYTYGSTFLSEPFPLGAGQPLKAIELVDRGIQNHPEYWRFYLDKGFIYFWYLEDYEKAAEVFLEGSKIEGAPFWMATTAGRTLTQSGQRDTARGLWRIIHDSAETEQQRENAALHLTQLDALDQMDALRRLVRVFEERVGRYPESWEELVAMGLLERPPYDPTGAPYVLDSAKRDVVLSADTRLGTLPSR
ncbi:MAG: tetratricopeptide repeat protein [Vicinamibacteria bacterium]